MARGAVHLNRFAQKLAADLFSQTAEQDRFLAALDAESQEGSALICLDDVDSLSFTRQQAAPYSPAWVLWVSKEERPGAHELHQRGAYYCCDFSSVFAAAALLDACESPNTVLDCCAAPGGKALFAARAFAPSHLVCNEALNKRVAMLISNLKRCRVQNADVCSRDLSVLAEFFDSYFDLVIVDAPCSGQSLLAKGIRVDGCFHPKTINMNSNRQKRILAHAARCVAPGGVLAYMTCTFSPKENEAVVSWLLKQMPEFESVAINRLEKYRSPRSTSFFSYRLYPQEGMGAGAFVAVLRRPLALGRRLAKCISRVQMQEAGMLRWSSREE